MKFAAPVYVLLFVLSLPTCSDSSDDSGSSDSSGAPAGFDPEQMTNMFSGDMTMTLDEDDLENFLAALTDLRKVGANIEQKLGNSPGDMKQFMTALGARSEWLEVIDDHNLNQVEFLKIQTNVMEAFAALQAAGPTGNVQQMLEQQRKSLEAMKASLPPEALARMEQGMKAAQTRMAGLLGDIPEANLELVRKNMDRIKAALR